MFNVVLSILGVLVAFPMKRRFINDEQQPFPEGRACGVLLDTLYTSAAAIGLFKARALIVAAVFAGTIKFLTGESYHTLIQGRLLGLSTIRWLSEHPVEKVLGWVGVNLPSIQGIDVRKLDLNPTINLEMFGAGGLMNIRYGTNMFIGMVFMWAVVAPPIINRGDVISSKGKVFTPPMLVASGGAPVTFKNETLAYPLTIAANLATTPGGISYKKSSDGPVMLTATATGVTAADGGAVATPLKIENAIVTDASGKKIEVVSEFNRGQVLNTWALWPGVAMLVCASMVSLFAKPQMFISAFKGVFARKSANPEADPLKHIEVPLWISAVGIPIVGAVGVWMAHEWFAVVPIMTCSQSIAQWYPDWTVIFRSATAPNYGHTPCRWGRGSASRDSARRSDRSPPRSSPPAAKAARHRMTWTSAQHTATRRHRPIHRQLSRSGLK